MTYFLTDKNIKSKNELNINKISTLLRIENIPENLELIKDLPIIALRDIDVQTNHIIRTILKISTIRELATIEISSEQMKSIRNKGISVSSMDKWIAASKIIKNIDNIEEKSKKKIIFLGLDNAGKTSIINILTNNFGIQTFTEMTPTKGVQRHELPGSESNYTIWDFGGQNTYQKQYLDNPERFLLGVDVLFYVIDIQANERYHKSFQYLKKILEIMDFLNERPEINILIHKVDPNIENDSKSYTLINEIQGLFKEILNNYQYEFFTTSIYNYLPTSINVVESLKSIFKNGLQPSSNENFSTSLDIIKNVISSFIVFNMDIVNTMKRIVDRMKTLEDIVIGNDVDNEDLEKQTLKLYKNIDQSIMKFSGKNLKNLNINVEDLFGKKIVKSV